MKKKIDLSPNCSKKAICSLTAGTRCTHVSSKLKQRFSVGGSVKNQTIIIQGNIRDKVMSYLSEIGFSVKRVGG